MCWASRMKLVPKLVSIGLATITLSGCWGGNSWYQKLTVTVSTPTCEVSGSSVSAVSYTFRDDWGGFLRLGDARMYRGSLRGEATVVEVAPNKYLFALLDEKTQELAFQTFFPLDPKFEGGWNQPSKEKTKILKSQQGSRIVPEDYYPMLVTFTDINNPKSVKEVKLDKLAEVFGTGYALKSITLEITGEAVTDGVVQKVVSWIGDPDVMENPGWKGLPITAQRAISGLLTDFRKVQNK
jgi:hypothetical protein